VVGHRRRARDALERMTDSCCCCCCNRLCECGTLYTHPQTKEAGERIAEGVGLRSCMPVSYCCFRTTNDKRAVDCVHITPADTTWAWNVGVGVSRSQPLRLPRMALGTSPVNGKPKSRKVSYGNEKQKSNLIFCTCWIFLTSTI